MRKDALIAIVGATGTGKSQLAVDLALKFNGEVINSDAMQLYKGLPIITNKVTLEEQKGVSHHLLGCVSLNTEPWRVDKFVVKALAAINDIRRRGKLPILVGGTHYYVQSLLFKNTLAVVEENGTGAERSSWITRPVEPSSVEADSRWPILEGSTSEILKKLEEVDPVMAKRWHPNDRRKIQRSLQIWLTTGKKASDIYRDQTLKWSAAVDGKTPLSNGNCSEANSTDQAHPVALRCPTLLLWTHTDTDILRERLDRRVDQMSTDDGLVKEAWELYQFEKGCEAKGEAPDKTRGIFVAVGYKEFLKYLNARWEGTCSNLEAERLKQEGYELTKTSTKQYTKRQLRWIRIKLFNAMRDARAEGDLFVLDTSQPDKWTEATFKPASEYTSAFIQGDALPRENNLHLVGITGDDAEDLSRNPDSWVRNTCTACHVTTVTTPEWTRHIHSHRHKKLTRKRDAAAQRGREDHAVEEETEALRKLTG